MYAANDDQLRSFDDLHDHLASKLELGKQILYLTKDQCVECGPGEEEIISIVNDTMIEHGKKAKREFTIIIIIIIAT